MYLWINKLQTSNFNISLNSSASVTFSWQRDALRGEAGEGLSKARIVAAPPAVLKIHQEIQNLSSYNRELFAWEMYIASRCHHPIVFHNSLNSLEQQTMNYQGEVPFWLQSSVKESSSRKLPELWSLSTAEVAVIFLDVAGALNFWHQKKPRYIIHSDISSSNLFVWRQVDQWRVKVSD